MSDPNNASGRGDQAENQANNQALSRAIDQVAGQVGNLMMDPPATAASALVSFNPNEKIETGIQRLTGKNWASWKWQIMNILDAKGLKATVIGPDEIDAAKELIARQIISASLDHTIVDKVLFCVNVREIWQTLSSIYENKTSFAVTDLISHMNSYKIESLDKVEAGISEIRSTAVRIRALGGAVDRAGVEAAILKALPKSFDSFISSWRFLDESKRSIEELQSHLISHTGIMRSRQAEAPKAKAFIARSDSRPSFKPQKFVGKGKRGTENGTRRFSGTCNFCKKPGHMIKDCRKLAKKKADEAKDGKSSDTKSNSERGESERKVALVATAVDKSSQARCLKATESIGEHIKTHWIVDSGSIPHDSIEKLVQSLRILRRTNRYQAGRRSNCASHWQRRYYHRKWSDRTSLSCSRPQ